MGDCSGGSPLLGRGVIKLDRACNLLRSPRVSYERGAIHYAQRISISMIDPEKIPGLLKSLGKNLEERVVETLSGKKEEDGKEREPERWPPMRNEYMEFMEPDWDELDKKANLLIARYAVVSGASSILPLGLDVAAATMTFSKMATELAGVYQVLVSAKRARQMGWAIATTTGTVLGATFGMSYAAGKLAGLIPGAGYLVSVAIQAPIVGAVAWAAGDALKGYFRECRQGREPSLQTLKDSFAKTLHLKLKTVKKRGREQGLRQDDLHDDVVQRLGLDQPRARVDQRLRRRRQARAASRTDEGRRDHARRIREEKSGASQADLTSRGIKIPRC